MNVSEPFGHRWNPPCSPHISRATREDLVAKAIATGVPLHQIGQWLEYLDLLTLKADRRGEATGHPEVVSGRLPGLAN